MQISDISLWGILATVMLLLVILALFSIVDRKLVTRMSRVSVYFILSLVFVAALMWGILKLNLWWVDMIWAVLLILSVAYLSLRKAHLPLRPFFLPLSLSLFLSSGLELGIMSVLTQLPRHIVILSVLSFFAVQTLSSMSSSLKTYMSSLRHTQEHCQYLLANGATHVEAILPSVRRSMRASVMAHLRSMTGPLVLAPPMLFIGLLMGGVSPLSVAVIVIVLMLVGLSVSVLASLLTIILVDRSLFDASGRFLY